MKLVLIRHGESEWNKLNLFTGWTDVELTEKGREEAANGGQLLKEQGFDFDICYTSYLKRAIHTLDIVLDQMDRSWLPVVKSWKLNERHYGALQGLNKAETAAKYGEEQVLIWRRSYATPPQSWMKMTNAAHVSRRNTARLKTNLSFRSPKAWRSRSNVPCPTSRK